ncbi:protein kinase [Ammoniphilus sp. CFH 90114]|uniref:serine/threonine protein kinase n=1 Tax=Ammoniphilus sp. CFH 90114 TaxID=2493665 RepID=UPI00100E30ED|nr:protein kinase [Ammoniphilus sp. CFH 90114]RXT03724.1 serine/threonine-protein kinase [Ammoniphilus sp. CFH 90114]
MIKKIWSYFQDRPYPAGTVIGDRYELVKILGMGSYGITYFCRDQIGGRNCVVKQLKPSKKKTKQGGQAYEYETTLLQQLDHPSIPKFYQQFQHGGDYFFSMEYMEGRNFEDLIFEDQTKYNERESLRIIQQLLPIVEYLHENGISHGDIRIPNVMMDQQQHMKLIDFGLAREIANESDRDFNALGHFLLFLLYTTYVSDKKKEASWEEELTLRPSTRSVIRRLFELDEPYSSLRELSDDLTRAINT